jgi:signal-transduction protein with cAMP-binding, CBS, and nucleotidyltransferase domain
VLLKGAVDVFLAGSKVISLSKAGSGFGELALLNPDSKRVATVIATENSTFITIAKKDYLYFLK